MCPDLTALADASVVGNMIVGRASHVLNECPSSLDDDPEPTDEYLSCCRDVYTCSYRQEAEAIIIALRRLLVRAESAKSDKPLNTLALFSDSQGALAAIAKGPFRQREGHIAVIWELLSRLVRLITGRVYLAFVYSHIGFVAHDNTDERAGAARPDGEQATSRIEVHEHANPTWWRDDARKRSTLAEVQCDRLASDQFRFTWHRHIGIETIRSLRALKLPSQHLAIQLRCGVAPGFGGFFRHEVSCDHCAASGLSRGAAVRHAFECPAETARQRRAQLLTAEDGTIDHSPRALWYNVAAAIKYWRWYTAGEQQSSPLSRAPSTG
jgi:hypothetical protein